MRDDMEDGATKGATVAPDARWMTYGELAAFLGIEEGSARRRVQREKWPRRTGNDGRARIAVPGDVQPGEAPAKESDAGEDASRLGELLGRERERAEAAERDREAARMEAAAAMGELRAIREHLTRERERAEIAERDREAARVEAAAAEGAARVLREELTRERERAEAARMEAAAAVAEGQGLREELGRTCDLAREAEAELVFWKNGPPFSRAWRAFWHR